MKKLALATGLALALSPALALAGGEVVAPLPAAPAPAPLPPAPAPAAPAPMPAPAPVSRGESGPYVALYGGANWLEDGDFDADGFGSGDFDADTGWIAGGAVGYAFDAGTVQPRAELDVSYRTNDIDEVNVGGISPDVDADISAISGMANVWLDVPVTDNLKPYAGGGVGLSRLAADDVSIGGTDLAEDHDYVFAWQLGAGVAYEFTPSLAATVDYRWFNADDPKFDDVETEYGTHSAMAGLRYKF